MGMEKNNGPAPAVKSAMDHENHYNSSEVMSLLVLVVGMLAVACCVTGRKFNNNNGYSRVPTERGARFVKNFRNVMANKLTEMASALHFLV